MTDRRSTEGPAMNNLIARLEAATEGSRELDAEIFLQIDPDAMDNEDGTYESPYFDQVRHYPRKYTTNLQDARSLGGMLVYASDIGADGLPMVTLVFDTSTSPVVEYTGIGATLELAWCIAALKAMEADND